MPIIDGVNKRIVNPIKNDDPYTLLEGQFGISTVATGSHAWYRPIANNAGDPVPDPIRIGQIDGTIVTEKYAHIGDSLSLTSFGGFLSNKYPEKSFTITPSVVSWRKTLSINNCYKALASSGGDSKKIFTRGQQTASQRQLLTNVYRLNNPQADIWS